MLYAVKGKGVQLRGGDGLDADGCHVGIREYRAEEGMSARSKVD